MMLILPTNTANFIGRVFMLLMVFFLFYLFSSFGLKDPKAEHVVFTITLMHFQFKAKYIMYFLLCAVVYLALTLVLSLLSVNKVQVDTIDGTITLKSLFTTKRVATSDISGYAETIHRNAAKVFYGLLISLYDGRRIQVAGQNVQNISVLKDFLNKKQIAFSGQQRMKFPFN